jgi:hypothetical protein
MTNIAILVPVCSRNQNYKTISDIPFVNKLYPSFLSTKEDDYNYTFFIGIDDDDQFYKNIIEDLKKYTDNIYLLSNCQHAPATAWNKLADISYKNSKTFDYFFQIGDDVKLSTFGWTSRFITKLKDHDNIGVVGPCNMINYNQRVSNGRPFVIENAFVSRRHLDIFGYLFYPEIKNWFCDDWLTRIYDTFFSEIQTDILCENTIIDTRYKIDSNVNINQFVEKGITHLNSLYGKHVFSFCLYGSDSKYCMGMIKNLEQINKLYPFFETWIHCGNDVPSDYIKKYKSFKNVKLIPYDTTGGRMMSYRFFTIDDPTVGLMVIRDADSRFHDRDIWCIQNFICSSFSVFTIRDHPYHNRKIMGGQWGMKRIPEIKMEKSYEIFKTDYSNIDGYRSDQDFIDKYVYDNPYSKIIAYTSNYVYPKEVSMQILCPRKTIYDFCGNVVLFDKYDNEYYQFSL